MLDIHILPYARAVMRRNATAQRREAIALHADAARSRGAYACGAGAILHVRSFLFCHACNAACVAVDRSVVTTHTWALLWRCLRTALLAGGHGAGQQSYNNWHTYSTYTNKLGPLRPAASAESSLAAAYVPRRRWHRWTISHDPYIYYMRACMHTCTNHRIDRFHPSVHACICVESDDGPPCVLSPRSRRCAAREASSLLLLPLPSSAACKRSRKVQWPAAQARRVCGRTKACVQRRRDV